MRIYTFRRFLLLLIIPRGTAEPVHTEEYLLKAAQVTGPICLKFCDSQFAFPVKVIDGVATLETSNSLQSTSISTCKSHVSLTQARLLGNIAEKVILRTTFYIGGYSFRCLGDHGQYYLHPQISETIRHDQR